MRDTCGLRPALISLVITLFLAACGGQPTRPTTDTDVPTDATTDIEPVGPDYIPGQFAPYLNEAEQALAEEYWLAAIAALQKVPVNLPPGTDSYRRSYLQARLTLQQGDSLGALQAIDNLLLKPIDRDLRQRSFHFRRYLLQTSGRYLESAHMQAEQYSTALPTDEMAQLRQAIWHDLQRVPLQQLDKASRTADDRNWQGWLALAVLDARAGSNVIALREGLTTWLTTYPQHPCAEQLPGGLSTMLDAPPDVERVVLMLPLSGRLAEAGKAVRDGYLAAWYAAVKRGWQAPELQLIDLDRESSAQQSYAQATTEGGNLVIGPLSKNRVAELANDPARTVPILALNRLDQPAFQGSAALVQMALAPEDEARELARLVYGRGHRQVLVLHPAARWGNEMAAAFNAQWQQLGGRLTATAGYSGQDDFSKTVESALGLPASQDRARRVRQTLGGTVEFTPRRRDDLDAVVILARSPDEARAIKPLLAFHYAGDLPAFSTSHASEPGATGASNADLNGMTVLEMPWLLTSEPLRLQLEAQGEPGYSRMQALGADAFLLQTRFTQLSGGPELALRGQTGLLTLDPQLRITRTLYPATFDGGALVPSTVN